MISICIPTYNRLSHLKRCLSSIRNGFGDYPYEVIIADGGSTDGTLEYLKDLDDDNVRLIEQGKLTGAVKAFNACFKKAENEYVFWPCDDYIVIPNVLIKCCKLMDKNPEIGIVSPKFIEAARSNFPNVGSWQHILVSSKTHVFRNSVLKQIDFFDENFKTYYVDVNSHLAVLDLGYVTLFTRDVGVIHNRIYDEIRKRNVPDKRTAQREFDYYRQKWKKLDTRFHTSTFKKNKAFQFWRLQNKLRGSRFMKFFMQQEHPFGIKLFDWTLQRCIVFEAKEYRHLKDFYLAQKLPKEMLKE